MDFEDGQKVVVSKALGEKRKFLFVHYTAKSRFYYGTKVKLVPIGSNVIIDRVMDYRTIQAVDKKGERYVFHPQELTAYESADLPSSLDKDLCDLLTSSPDGRETLEQRTEEGKFAPKFNAKEEFVVWINKEFPHLRGHADLRVHYDQLDARRDEVLEAASIANAHAMETTNSCVRRELHVRYRYLIDSGPKDFPIRIVDFSNLISHVSYNLVTDKKHYGSRVVVTNYGK